MAKAATIRRRTLHIHFPAGQGEMILRTDDDWERDLRPALVSADGLTTTFVLESARPFLYLKPCLRTDSGQLRWSVGRNLLVLMTFGADGNIHPYFEGGEKGSFTDPIELDSRLIGRRHRLRVYLPPGYHENPLRRYPVCYMHDGRNLFFPAEAFNGREWQVDESLQLLDLMCVIDRVLIVGVSSDDRNNEYTLPGYEAYARSIVEEVRPEIARSFRVFDTPRETGVIGSSLGGVAAFYMAWQYPQVFGFAACMSSTFGWRDDLIERVLSEPRSPARFYLDSGWPRDNYEVTLAMSMALAERGYKVREEFLHLAFPGERHDEKAWGRRLHLPLQLALGRPAVMQRRLASQA